MLDVDIDTLGADTRILLAVDGDLVVTRANHRAAERFDRPSESLDGVPLAALFGAAGTREGVIGRAVVAGQPAALFLPADVGEDLVRADVAPLARGEVLIAIDPEDGRADDPLRLRVRALAALAASFRKAEDVEDLASAAEAVVGEVLGVRASFVPLVWPSSAPSRFGGVERRGPERRHRDLVIPSRVRAGEIVAVDDLRHSGGLLGEVAAADMLARGTEAVLWVALVREGRPVSAMLVEADAPRRWAGGAVTIVASVLDRTDTMSARLESMAALAAAEERFRVLVDAAAAAVWEADAEGLVVEASRSWCALTGQTASAMSQHGWMDAVHPQDRDRVRAAWTAAVASGRPFDVEARLSGPGGPRWMNLKAAPLRAGRKAVSGWVGMAIDVSLRKGAEEDLRAGEARLRTLLEGIPQLVWRAAASGERSWSSPQWGRSTGQPLAASLGTGWLEVVHPDDRAATMEAWRAATAAAPLQIDHRLFDVAAGRHRWFQTRATALVDAQGAAVEWLGTSTDIDTLRRMEEDQRHFVAELQHRTRNLIAVVQSIVRQSLPRSPSPDVFAAALEGRLKSLSRVQGILSRGPRAPIRLGDLVRMEVDAVADGAAPGRITIEGPDVPIRRSAVQLLTLALHELAENARRHGALAGDDGVLDVRWSVVDQTGGEVVAIVWREDFGARQDQPVRPAGYGRDLIENALRYSLGADVALTLEPTGMRCVISLVCEELAAAAP